MTKKVKVNGMEIELDEGMSLVIDNGIISIREEVKKSSKFKDLNLEGVHYSVHRVRSMTEEEFRNILTKFKNRLQLRRTHPAVYNHVRLYSEHLLDEVYGITKTTYAHLAKYRPKSPYLDYTDEQIKDAVRKYSSLEELEKENAGLYRHVKRLRGHLYSNVKSSKLVINN